ncbi:MAG: ATP-dependent DNA helicase RecG [Spirochaetales bacterium]|nr:ATP-dependent DNA helicase RecG [Spirochaetales bacterium]
MFLREFSNEVRFLKGVGPRLSEVLGKLSISTISDLILHCPRDYVDRSRIDHLKDALKKEKVNCIVEVVAHDYIGKGYRKTLKIHIEDATGTAVLLCFGRAFLESVFVPGKRFLVSGTFKYRFGEVQSSNFEYEPYLPGNEDFKAIIPIYPLTAGITQGVLRRIMRGALDVIRDTIENELPERLITAYRFPHKSEALRTLHFPDSTASLLRARQSLVYEELFYLQLLIKRRAIKRRIQRKSRSPVPFALENRLLDRLPFSLTKDQRAVISEIKQDLFSPFAASRLLHGDVGCGKTLVAVILSLSVIESGEQVAFMAPTELLARQHADRIADLLQPIGIRIGFLSGSVRDEERKLLLDELQSGNIDLLVGTHALFSDDIAFRNLGFVIIDEQHRFGVLQRLSILKKGRNPDLLLMTATPIPRTLALTAFGDLEISTIRMQPEGRIPVITHLTREGNESRVYRRVREEISQGRQAYVVYPIIEESDSLALKDAETGFDRLSREIFPDFRCGLIHSRLQEDHKRKVMEDFSHHHLDILVATSVVEVGVDVPEATCMVIEHAERFGLSALHQLRGRVCRSVHQSYAFLIYGVNLTEDGIRRLKVMMETTDGFRIAEEDLAIRGPGELLGVKQSGFLRLTVSDLIRDKDILEAARKDAFSLLEDDPGFITPENMTIREVLNRAPPFSDEFLDGG